MEIWKEIKDYPLYQVSNLGRVKSLKYGKEKILKAGSSKNGYLQVALTANKAKSFYVHRLVASHFVDNENNEKNRVVDHIDNDKTNNFANNLQFITQRKNLLKNHPKKNNLFQGIVYDKQAGRYKANIQLGHKKIFLGSHKTDKEYLSILYIKAKELIHLYNGDDKTFRELVRSLCGEELSLIN